MKRVYLVCLVLLLGLGLMLIRSILLIKAWASIAEVTPKEVTQEGAGVGDRITLHAAGRGNPWINLRDGVDLPTTYTGAAGLTQILEGNLARPLSLASGDFDEDGVPDLVSGYAGPGGGILTLHRGNVDSIYPNNPEAQKRKAEGTFTDLPFLSPARVFEVPEAPEFLGTGDFDNDGHLDVVAAAHGDNMLYLLPGDGQGGFGPAKQIELPGTVTALVTGEINRRDGLDDVVVGIVGANGPEVLVFEGPEEALRREPEVFALPAEATALALGQLDDSYEMDLAVAAGSELLIVHGRDRKLSLDEIRQAEVPPATVDHRSFPFAITSVAVGDFVWDQDHRTDIALLSEDGTVHLLERGDMETGVWDDAASVPVSPRPHVSASLMARARVSSLPTDDLVVLDQVNRQLHILTDDPETQRGTEPHTFAASPHPRVTASLAVNGQPVAVLPMRLNEDALSDLVILRSGQSALTVALTASSATFTVNSTGDASDSGTCDGVCAIDCVRDPEDPSKCQVINGCIIPAGPCTLRAAIEQANASPGADAIVFGVSTISPTSLLPTITGPVTIDGATAGQVELSGSGSGLWITAGSSTVRGMVIHGVGTGILLATNEGNVIEGNYIGTDVTGTTPLGNYFYGMFIFDASNNNTIGGTTAGARNVISGNGGGVYISVSDSTGNLVQGNFIGTDVTGTAALGNSSDGMDIFDASNNTIGGTTPGAGNVISGNNGNGVDISFSDSTGNQVQGNYIGTDVTGTAALGNDDDGVTIFDGSSNTIGGTASGASNTIAFNGDDGVDVWFALGPGNANAILSNSIFSNTGLGIDLGGNGVTPNDEGDSDTGANNLQNFPVLTSASSSGGSTTIGGTLNSTPNTTFTLEFFSNTACDPSGFGEGKTFIGSTTVTTDGSGNASFAVTFPEILSPGAVVTATATDPSGNTSEFSQCITVEGETSCTYTILPQSALFPASGGPGFVNVAALPDCSWIAMSKDPTWIIVISGGGGTGSGVVNYNVLPNPNVEPRTGTLTIVGEDGSGNDHTVNQAGSPPPVKVRVPNGAEEWLIGRPGPIIWQPGPGPIPFSTLEAPAVGQHADDSVNVTGDVEDVKIELSRDGGLTFETLFESTPNNGLQIWRVTGPATSQALIRISDASDPSVSDTSDAPFTINEPAR